MKKSDKVLVGIVGAIIVLIIATLAITLTQPEPTYKTDPSPESVVHNYLLALKKEDYDVAYGYLSPKLSGYPPNVARFHDSISTTSWNFRRGRDTAHSIDPASIFGSSARVRVNETVFYAGDLFDSHQYVDTFYVRLRLEEGEWKIVDSENYFAWCWKRIEGCR